MGLYPAQGRRRACRLPRAEGRHGARDPVSAGPRQHRRRGQSRPARRCHGRAVRAGPPQPSHQAQAAGGAATPRRRTGSTRDRITSLVLALHAAVDRPLGFDQVVELSGNRVTRAQVRTASAVLCREGDLDRIRSGVYQWSAGQRAAARHIPAARRALPRQAPCPRSRPGPQSTPPGRISAAELFGQLFPARRPDDRRASRGPGTVGTPDQQTGRPGRYGAAGRVAARYL